MRQAVILPLILGLVFGGEATLLPTLATTPQEMAIKDVGPSITVQAAPAPNVTVQAAPAPNVTVQAAPAPNVTVQAAPAPQVTVQAAPPANVHVDGAKIDVTPKTDWNALLAQLAAALGTIGGAVTLIVRAIKNHRAAGTDESDWDNLLAFAYQFAKGDGAQRLEGAFEIARDRFRELEGRGMDGQEQMHAEHGLAAIHLEAVGPLTNDGVAEITQEENEILRKEDELKKQVEALRARKQKAGITAGLLACAVMLFTGCETTVAVKKSNADVKKAVANVQQNTVPWVANYIATQWANHEDKHSLRLFNQALKENSQSVSINGVSTAVVSEPTRQALQAKRDQDAAQIAIGKQQIGAAVSNMFAGDLQAAQNLLDGQTNYYNTVGQGASTLSTGAVAIVKAFEDFAPILTAKK